MLQSKFLSNLKNFPSRIMMNPWKCRQTRTCLPSVLSLVPQFPNVSSNGVRRGPVRQTGLEELNWPRGWDGQLLFAIFSMIFTLCLLLTTTTATIVCCRLPFLLFLLLLHFERYSDGRRRRLVVGCCRRRRESNKSAKTHVGPHRLVGRRQ